MKKKKKKKTIKHIREAVFTSSEDPRFEGEVILLTDFLNSTTKRETVKQIAKMIASGEIPSEVYNKYLSKCEIGFMNEKALLSYLLSYEEEISDIKKRVNYNSCVECAKDF